MTFGRNALAVAKGLAAMVIGATLICSCSTAKRSPLPYFEDIQQTAELTVDTDNYSPKIEPDDELFIMVTSRIPGATAAYNLPMQNPGMRQELLKSVTPQQQTYIVDSKGDILFPVLGKVHVAGLTTMQLADELTRLIGADVEDPEVYVRLVNFKVNVAGEVRQPGQLTVTNERFSILDALSAAGDLTEFGERDRVLLVREEDGKRTAHRLNLNSSDLLTSPYFYLKQNDYVYVEPNQIRVDNSKYNTNNAYKVTVISTIVSACSVVASLVIALTVK